MTLGESTVATVLALAGVPPTTPVAVAAALLVAASATCAAGREGTVRSM
jgi:hypothetical protein